MAFVQTAHSLDPAKPGASVYSIEPINWRRYPQKTISAAMAQREYIEPITYYDGAANEGATADNAGEHGTANSTAPSRGVGWNHQEGKAAALGLGMAVDVTKSYHGTRGAIEPCEPYPSVSTAQVPAAFRNANYVAPGTP
jgi:hypothetical protein